MKKKRPIRVGIDARTLQVSGGVKVYAENLISNLKKNKEICIFLYGHNDNSFIRITVFRFIWENLILPFLLIKDKIDIFHGLKNAIPLFSFKKRVVTIHDLTIFKFPHDYTLIRHLWKYMVSMYIKKADHIIAISKSTKKDLIKHLKINQKKITVIYEGYDQELFRIKNKTQCYKQILNFFKEKEINISDINRKKIILNVNTIQPRKNISRLIKAFDNIAKDNKNAALIISGKTGWKTKKIFETYNKSPYKGKIYFLDYTPNEIVANLYNISEVFVYPSLYEGFGLPILEAQACGCPVITSNISSMPEVAGESAILINPYNVNEISEAMLKITSDNNLRNNLIKEGFENCKRFSWKKCAEETFEMYNKFRN